VLWLHRMPLWKLLKMSREILSTWRELADEERERVREEADHVRRLMGELTHLAGPLGKRIATEAAPDEPRDIKTVSAELLHAVTQLGGAIGPGAVEATRRNSPRGLRAAGKLGSLGAREARKRWS
jgi:hypothetical protein